TKWCVAMTIDSLSEDPVAGTTLNTSCQRQILGGLEYVNFAYLTLSGTPQAAANPLQFDPVAGGKPQKGKALFMNQGDRIQVSLHDTAHGLQTQVDDLTTHQSGSMTASAANGFGQIAAAPTGTSCTQIPYDFHPEYSTSSPQTRVPWAAHSYNIAFSDEIGHFDYCTSVDPSTGSCTGLEGVPGDQEAADGDDNACFTPAQSTRVKVTGCVDTNSGFDGTSYLKGQWPDGNLRLHPEPFILTSPRTGPGLRSNYQRVAFEADTPRIEAPDLGGSCNRATGEGCTLVPKTDDGAIADFYPFFTTNGKSNGCEWVYGNDVPGLSKVDFGGVNQYGSQLSLQYLVFGGGGATQNSINNYRQILSGNPCRS
ncbi:MAG: hypothetical protein J2P15_14695, partial [Micromonosporaceae bacterium]|nr:hypothetical protein [Micromonosporaceae bacterium]